jgi:hypothetical protein
MRFRSRAGRHLTVPSLMTYAPTGRAVRPKPPALTLLTALVPSDPAADTSPECRRGDDGHAIALVGLGEDSRDGQPVAGGLQ